MDGGKIKAARRQRRLTQERVAAKMHCDRSYISKIETNIVKPPPDFLQSLCEHLGVTLDKLSSTNALTEARNEEPPELARGRRLVREGRMAEAQIFTETVYGYLIPSGNNEAANSLFQEWLNTLPEFPRADQLGFMFLTQMFGTAVRHEWPQLFSIGLNFQRALVQAGQLTWAEWVSRTLLTLNPPPSVRFRLEAGLGTVVLRLGRPEESAVHYHSGLSLWIPDFKTVNLGRCYHGIGATALYSGDVERAKHMTQSACDIYHDVNDSLYHMALQNLGIIYARSAQRQEAERAFITAMDFWKENQDDDRIRSLELTVAQCLI